MPARRLPLLLLVFTSLVFLGLGWQPKADRFTWFMENLPVLVGAPVLVATYRRFPLTTLLYLLLALHALVLMVGGHWTYAEVPAGHWVKAS